MEQDSESDDKMKQGGLSRATVLSGAVDSTWLPRPMTHQQVVDKAERNLTQPRMTRRRRRALEVVSQGVHESHFRPWPRRSMNPTPPPPPAITAQLVRDIQAQDRARDPDTPLPPAGKAFVTALANWHAALFGMSKRCYARNTRTAAGRIRERIAFLPPERVKRIMAIVETGYKVPFSSNPPAFHRRQNNPELRQHKEAAWAALTKDMAHGAVVPCDIVKNGKPSVVSPVRTAPKGWRTGKRRFVVSPLCLGGVSAV